MHFELCITRRNHLGRAERTVTVGLVNLMPAAAAHRTEAEYRALLQTYSQGINVRLQCFADTVPSAKQSTTRTHQPLDALWESHLDGLIVTGAEPRAGSIAEEPLLALLRQVVVWGAQHTKSVMFSCFAAHAAVWCIDGIARRPLAQKLSGVFTTYKTANHRLVAGMPDQWVVPHSRHNTLDEMSLRAGGYHILASSPQLNADIFSKRHGVSEFVFLQGHPEYGPEVLLSEYSRDVRRFIDGSSPNPPCWPENYLGDLGQGAPVLTNDVDPSIMKNELTRLKLASERSLDHPWHDAAARLMAGWLSLIAPQEHHTAQMVSQCTT